MDVVKSQSELGLDSRKTRLSPPKHCDINAYAVTSLRGEHAHLNVDGDGEAVGPLRQELDSPPIGNHRLDATRDDPRPPQMPHIDRVLRVQSSSTDCVRQLSQVQRNVLDRHAGVREGRSSVSRHRTHTQLPKGSFCHYKRLHEASVMERRTYWVDLALAISATRVSPLPGTTAPPRSSVRNLCALGLQSTFEELQRAVRRLHILRAWH
jgi:hypothetical protein